MKKKLLLLLAIVIALCGSASAQTALTQTTLAAAMTAGPASGASGITGSYSTTVNLTSATGIQQAVNGQPITFAYIDQELVGILSLVPGQTTIYGVLRGQLGTRAAAHSLGAMVLIEVVSPQFGGFSGSGGFQQADPPGGNGATCVATSTLAYPWVNVLTGAQWLCSPVTGTWTPGFNNPLLFVEGVPNAATVASASALAVPSSFFSVSGSTALTSLTLPVGCGGQSPLAASTVGTCTFGIYSTGTWAVTAGNNIATTCAAQVAGHVSWWYYNPVTQKFGTSC